MAIKAIIFDCFGVLVKAGHVLLRQDHPELKEMVYDLQNKSDSGQISRQQFNQAIADKIGLTPQQVDDRYWGINKFNQPVIDWILELRQSGQYKIGMLSNINRDWMDVCLPFFDRESLFDAEVLSGDVNLTKPDPAIFILAADRLNLQPEECVMIDDLATNVNGAKLAGMEGIVFTGKDQAQVELNQLLGNINA